ncbi:LemA family protein (plasmid) [Pontibacillus sp. ALD_SL1]|uniref:LemA family protein n=1 Tax=Pontibacillus sp. ALD_SL1 TaxID=2777185 RepID=UPI001A972564|nr:LemA family protein [Pontibacillus sp. ALD_SL1]QST02376.1 LemA family protein [Pontibacillus sp. ALD_SL1]
MFLWAAGGLILVGGVYLVSEYNSLVSKKNKVDEAFAGIEAHLQERFDNISTQAETLSGLVKHEYKVFTEVVKMRKGGYVPQTMEEKIELNNKLDECASLINMVGEEYPDIRSTENFEVFQKTINVLEDKLSASRRAFNAAVYAFNNKLETFPTNIVAGMFGGKFKRIDSFKAEERAQQRVSVSGMFGDHE